MRGPSQGEGGAGARPGSKQSDTSPAPSGLPRWKDRNWSSSSSRRMKTILGGCRRPWTMALIWSAIRCIPRVTFSLAAPTVLKSSTNQTEEPRITRYRTESDRSTQPPRAFRRGFRTPRSVRQSDRALLLRHPSALGSRPQFVDHWQGRNRFVQRVLAVNRTG